MVSEAITVSHGSYLTTFVKGSPPRNGSNYVKTEGVLMPSKWGCGGQEVPEGGFSGSVPWVISNNFCKRVSFQKWLKLCQEWGCPYALGLRRTGGS